MSDSFLELSRKSRHFDERMLNDGTMTIGRGRNVSIVVQPSLSPGYAFVSLLIGNECSWTKRPIRRDAVPAMIDMELPKRTRITWEFVEESQRVAEAMFTGYETRQRLLFEAVL
jgi:hypothetical protein